MRTLVCLMLIFITESSFGMDVSVLPLSEFADTEVSTNFTFAVGEGGCKR